MGVEWCLDVVNLWPNADAWLDQLADSLGYTPGAEVRMNAASVYSHLARAARLRTETNVANLVQSRLSSFPSGEASQAAPAPSGPKGEWCVALVRLQRGAVC